MILEIILLTKQPLACMVALQWIPMAQLSANALGKSVEARLNRLLSTQYISFLASSPDGNHKHKYLIGKDFYPHIFQSPHFFLPAFKSEQFIIISRTTPINRNTLLLFSCCLQILKHWNKCLILHYLSAYLCAEIMQWIYLSFNWTRVLCAWFIRIIICSETADLVRYFTFRSCAPEDSIVFLSYSTAQ